MYQLASLGGKNSTTDRRIDESVLQTSITKQMWRIIIHWCANLHIEYDFPIVKMKFLNRWFALAQVVCKLAL